MFRKVLEALYAKMVEKVIERDGQKIVLVEEEDSEYQNIANQMKKFEKDAVLNKLLSLEKRVTELNGKIVALSDNVKNLCEVMQYNNSTLEELLNLIGGEIAAQYGNEEEVVIEEEEGGEEIATKTNRKLNIN